MIVTDHLLPNGLHWNKTLVFIFRIAEKYNLKLEFKHNFDEYFYMRQKDGEFLLNKMEVLEVRRHFTFAVKSVAMSLTLVNLLPQMYPPPDPSMSNPEEYSYAQSFLEENRNIRSVGTISKSEWDAVSLYSVFCFRKVQNR